MHDVISTLDLGTISIIRSPISMHVDIGETDHVIHKVIQITFSLTNLLKIPLPVKLCVLRSDVFMFAGTNEVSFLFLKISWDFRLSLFLFVNTTDMRLQVP